MAVDAKTEALIARLAAMLEPLVVDLELELVELQFRREPAGWVLRLIIDGPQGISLDDCSRVSREAGHLLEVEDPIEWPYRLEVSSPGLDSRCTTCGGTCTNSPGPASTTDRPPGPNSSRMSPVTT